MQHFYDGINNKQISHREIIQSKNQYRFHNALDTSVLQLEWILILVYFDWFYSINLHGCLINTTVHFINSSVHFVFVFIFCKWLFHELCHCCSYSPGLCFVCDSLTRAVANSAMRQKGKGMISPKAAYINHCWLRFCVFLIFAGPIFSLIRHFDSILIRTHKYTCKRCAVINIVSHSISNRNSCDASEYAISYSSIDNRSVRI